jgi:outer membrane protein assembly factor BamB
MPRTIAIAVLGFMLTGTIAATDWPQWRGPGATGVAPGNDLPLRWSATDNVAWKAPLDGLGVSTPIVSGDRVFVTSQSGAGVRRAGNHPRLVQGGDAAAAGERALGGSRETDPGDRVTFLVEAFRRTDGRRVWERRIEAEGPLPAVHDKHNLASSSPVTDGAMLYAWFGTGQIAAMTLDGTIVWQRHLGKEIAPFEINWGHTSSPVVHGELLLLLCDHAPASYLLALDKKTGRERWKADRGQGRASYSTPLVVQTPNGDEIVVNSSDRVDGYDAKSGELRWHVGDANRFPIPAPVVRDGVIYMSRGYRSGPYFALRTGGRGDLSSSPHVLWHVPTGAPYVSSLLYYDGLVYMANDVGVLTAVDAADGRRVWQERVDGVFSASPIAGAGHVYFPSEGGVTFVVKAGPKPEIVARNDLGVRIIASPAAAGGRLFVRTDDHLFSIGR